MVPAKPNATALNSRIVAGTGEFPEKSQAKRGSISGCVSNS
jgi:hypothetical protein